jgi:hypothetical protein
LTGDGFVVSFVVVDTVFSSLSLLLHDINNVATTRQARQTVFITGMYDSIVNSHVNLPGVAAHFLTRHLLLYWVQRVIA